MLKVGDEIIVGEINDFHIGNYSLDRSLTGRKGVITDIRLNRYYVHFGRHETWWFPIEENIISAYLKNKWNPLNYKSHFQPLKLP